MSQHIKKMAAGEQAVQEIERRVTLFEAVFRDSPQAMVLSDPDHQVIFANPAFFEMFGFEAEGFVGSSIASIYKSSHSFKAHAVALDDHTPLSEFTFRRKDGTLFPCETSRGPVHGANGNTLGYVTIIHDISQRRAMEEEVQRRAALVELMRAASETLPRATTARQAYTHALELISDFAGLPVGHALTLSKGRVDQLESTGTWWRRHKDINIDALQKSREEMTFSPAIGVPGRVLVSGNIVHIQTLADDPTLPQDDNIFTTCIGLPVTHDGDVVGVLEFFAPEIHTFEDNDYFFSILHEIGSRLGHSLARIAQNADFSKLAQAVEQSHASIFITDRDGVIEYVNPSFSRVTGFESDEVVGHRPNILKSGRNSEELYKELWATIASGQEWRGELLNKRKDGGLIWEYASISPVKNAEGTITHFVAVKEDISVRKEYEEKLIQQAHYDDLTGLPKKLLAMDRLDQAVNNAVRDHYSAGILYLNVDDLQKVNQTLGHDAGDEVLRELARRVQDSVRETDTVARVEGDEFMVIAPELKMGVVLELTARRIIEACNAPVKIGEHEVNLSVRIGMSVCPADGVEPPVLIRNAHAAMNRSREKGGNTYTFFTPKMEEDARQRLLVETHLRHALENDELFLHYQPQVDLASGKITGAEALLRWTNPELGFVPPDHFIPIAESSGLIVDIGEWVLEEACKTAMTWPDSLGVAVNVSVRQFEDHDFVSKTAEILEKTGLPPHRLEIEMTERLLIGKDDSTAAILHAFSDSGVKLSIDDFGTGYSALSYLKRYPFDTLKIDKSFVDGVTVDDESNALTHAIVAMAQALELNVVAEGVETMEQLKFLKKRKCQTVQGYYFSKPLTKEDFADYLKGQ